MVEVVVLIVRALSVRGLGFEACGWDLELLIQASMSVQRLRIQCSVLNLHDAVSGVWGLGFGGWGFGPSGPDVDDAIALLY